MLKKFLARKDFSFVFDAMHAVTGPYAKKIFEQELGAKPGSVVNAVRAGGGGGAGAAGVAGGAGSARRAHANSMAAQAQG